MAADRIDKVALETIRSNVRVEYPIRLKIFLVSLLPTLALIAAVLLNGHYLNLLGQSAEQILSQNYKSIKAAQQMRQALEANRNGVLEHMLGDQPGALGRLDLPRIAAGLAVCHDNITEPGEKRIIDALVFAYGDYQKLFASVKYGPQAPGTLTAEARRFITLTAAMIADIHGLVDLNEEAMEKAEKETRLLAGRALRQSMLLLFAAILPIVALSYILSRRVAEPITDLSKRLASTKGGNIPYPQLPIAGRDEIGLLTDEFNRLFKRLETYDRYNVEIIAAEKQKVRQAEEAKGRFIADLSHQLKTPMTSLAMGIGLLHEKGDKLSPANQHKLLGTAKEDCHRLSALINELVDIARLEAMVKPVVKEKLNAEALIRQCLKPLLKQAEEKGVGIAIDVQPDLPAVTLDSFRFPWVITNLVGNALRYTDRGGQVTLNVRKEGERFYFQCIDTGSGIDPQYMLHIFDRYTQFSDRSKSGTVGLGLAIVKDIIEQHGGDIRVESRMGEGTAFTFWIPCSEEKLDEKSADH